MRIALIYGHPKAFSYEAPHGGAERVILALAGQYASRGHDVTILNGLSGDKSDDTRGVRFVGLGSRHSPYCLTADYDFRAFLKIRGMKLDVLHAVSDLRILCLSVFMKPPPQSRILTVETDPHSFLGGSELSLGRVVPRKALLAPVHAVTAPSRYTIRYLESQGLPPRIRTVVIPNGVDLSLCEAAPTEKERGLVVYVGSIAPEKGVHVLVDAWRSFRPRMPSARLMIVGSPDIWGLGSQTQYSAALRNAADELGGVEFLGVLEGRAKMSLLARAEVCVVPSTYEETFCLVALEAQAAGCATIGTDAGALPETLGFGRFGLVVPKGDSRALAAALAEVLTNPKTRLELELAGKRNAADYDWSKIANVYLDLYTQELARRDE